MMLRLKRIFWALLASASISSGALAETWKVTDDKGLMIYRVGNGSTGEIMLVCDPEDLWATDPDKGSSQFFLSATLNNEQLVGQTISIRAGDFNASFPYEGRAVLADARWNLLIEALSKSKSVSVAVADKQFTLALDMPLDSQCLKPVRD